MFYKIGVATLLRKRLQLRCFPVNFEKLLRTFFYRTPLKATSVRSKLVVEIQENFKVTSVKGHFSKRSITFS